MRDECIVYTAGLVRTTEMKTVVLVLLAAASAIAAPSVILNEYEENEIARSPPSNHISSGLIDRAFDIVDGGDTNVHILNLMADIKLEANQGHARTRAAAAAQAIGVLVELASGLPGDACAASAFTDAYVNAVRSGNSAGLRAALIHLIERLNVGLQYVVKLVNDPNSVKYVSGPGSGCVGGGRQYQFEKAWDLILGALDINDAYCSAKRLHNAFNVRSNNVGAVTTTLSLPPLVEVFELSIQPALNFLKAVGNGVNPSAQAAVLSEALLESAARIDL